MMQKIKEISVLLWIALTLGCFISLASPGDRFSSWMAASLLLFLSLIFLYWAWSHTGKGRLSAWMIGLAFGLRLILGLGLNLALPVFGYPEPCQQAGYVFKDACRRDQEAYAFSQSSDTLFYGSGIDLTSDQYGGMVYLSAWIYRYISPDAHRPVLVLIIGAFFAALGVPFFYNGLRHQWSQRATAIAAWIYVLYPDAIFFSSSQMREPLLVGLSAIAFWSIMSWQGHRTRRLAVFMLAILGMAFLSPRIAVISAVAMLVWIGIDRSLAHSKRRMGWGFWLSVAFSAVLIASISWNWMQAASGWDTLVTIRQSGWMQKIIREAGDDRLIYPIIAVYGLAQPVLPAAIADTNAVPLWRAISISRSAGWYLLAPFLVYGVCAFRVEQDARRRRLLFWVAGVVIIWLIIAAVRGGGDLTDNPRYRSLFIPWLALLAGWAIDQTLQRQSVLLAKMMAVEAVFLLCFMSWYSARYFHFGIKLPFWQMVTVIIGISVMILVGNPVKFLWRTIQLHKVPHLYSLMAGLSREPDVKSARIMNEPSVD